MTRLCLVAFVAALLLPLRATAQVRPDLQWRTLTTEHFRVHFTPELEALARRTAANAEFAWAELRNELVPPRTMVDIVVADNADYANGYATPYPTNRIVVYARPPVEEPALRNHEDWNRLLVTHELVHIFHLDRVKGIWALGQRVFGRAAPLFPNTYAPRWLTEGLAVHYESKLAGGGRLRGTEFPAYVRAAAIEGRLPSLDALSLETPFFPGGNAAYLFGSYAVTRADSARMGRLVEASSARLLPWRHDRNAKDAFGIDFTARWAEWRDSVVRRETAIRIAVDPATTLTDEGFTARFPRFVRDDALLYVADEARRTPGAYELDLEGKRVRLGRRNSVDISAPFGDRGSVQGELDFTDPYTLRSELYTGSGLRRRAVTRGERLSSPDVHIASGMIVAVRTDPGTTSLVTVDPSDDFVTRDVVLGSLDRTWAEPRFSRDGQRIAAVRWERGGRNAVVVMDRAGRPQRSFAPRGERMTVVSSPVWEPGDTTLLFVSDHEGRALIYRGDVRTGAYGRVWTSATVLHTPDVSPSGRRVAAVELRADGYHVVVRDRPASVPLELPAADTLPDPLRPLAPAAMARDAIESDYSPWEQLYPSWWLPVVRTTGPGTASIGGMSAAHDVVGRHAWALEASVESNREEWTAHGAYAFAGFGVPVLQLDLFNEWEHGVIRDTGGDFIGYLGQRAQRVEFNVIAERPRIRFSSYAVLGGEFQAVRYRSYPAGLIAGLGNLALERVNYSHAVQATLGFSTMQRPANAVSSEDGIAGSVTHRERFNVGLNFEDVAETIVGGSAAKSIPFPGFARQVLAARGAYGVTGHATTAAFAAGGVSGSSLEVLPGMVIGSTRRTFGVRGFPGGAQLGVRALAASMEYRAPLTLVGRGVKLLPVFLQKTSLTAFADAGRAWCEFPVADSFICPATLPERTTLASVGGELGVDAAIQYDQVYRFRLGFAHPVRGEAYAAKSNTLYFSLGSSF